MQETAGQRYRYQVREFKVEDGGSHQCQGNVVSVLQSYYNEEKRAWYLTVLVQRLV